MIPISSSRDTDQNPEMYRQVCYFWKAKLKLSVTLSNKMEERLSPVANILLTHHQHRSTLYFAMAKKLQGLVSILQ